MAAVSVVLLNWNSGRYGAVAAQSVRDQTIECELIVVDNASQDDSLEQIQRAVSTDLVVEADRNLGFGAGMNLGIARATCDFVLPLNCDVQLNPDFVEKALAVLESDPAVAVVGGAVSWVDELPLEDPLVDGPVDEGPTDLTLTMRTVRIVPPVDGPCTKVSGSCPVMRVSALRQVTEAFGAGPYDPLFDTYGEDIDLVLKLARLGWTITHDGSFRAAHLRSFSSARRLVDKRGRLRQNIVRGRWISILRHVPTIQLPGAVVLALGEDIALGVTCLARRDYSIGRDVVEAWRFVALQAGPLRTFRRANRSTFANVPRLGLPTVSL